MNSIDLYNEYEKDEHGNFKDKEITQSFIQNVMSEAAVQNHKYVIKLKRNKNETPKVKTNIKKEVKGKKEEIVEKKIDQMNKTFESMMVQFQHMVQMNQLIQMNQMNQMQIMNQLLELKSNVIETRQDLSYKLKEINGQIDNIKNTQSEQGAKINELNNKRTSNAGRKPKEISNDSVEDNADYSHLYPLYKENIFTLLQTRNVNMLLVKNILKSKNMSGFIKIFDMLYKSKNTQNVDIYPIRVIKSKTLQYYNEDHNWLIDTNGTNIMNIVSSNIVLVLSKVNNDFFESGEFDSTLFIDNHNFIQELDDKKIKNQLFSSIKDLIINHTLNYKESNVKKDKEGNLENTINNEIKVNDESKINNESKVNDELKINDKSKINDKEESSDEEESSNED